MLVTTRKLKNGSNRLAVRVDKFDTWSLDNTLAHIILPALLQLKASQAGIPSDLSSDIAEQMDGQLVFDFIHDDKDEVFDKRIKEWDHIMNKMIWSFQQIVKGDWDDKYHHREPEFKWTDSEHTVVDPVTGKTEHLREMKDMNPGGHWFDRSGYNLHHERIQEGLDLFGRYYMNLWD